MKTFKANWGRPLVIMSVITVAICVFVIFIVGWSQPKSLRWLGPFLSAVLVISALFTIRGYAVTPDELLIQRLLWRTRIPLAGLQSVRFEPDAMQGSLRLFGNGGFLSFSGLFYNKPLGRYRGFVTDLHPTVVLRFAKRTVVVSPAPANDFVHDVEAAARDLRAKGVNG